MQTENKISPVQWIFLAALSIGGSILWTYFSGKDLNWDSLNYHFYVAYQWEENRLSKDFMAAGVQSYLNPVAYLPFYWMVKANLHSLVIGSTLAAIHAINLILIAVIANYLVPRSTKWRFAWVLLSVLIAAINPVFATEVGNTFVDIITSIFVLAGYAICLRWLTRNVETESYIRHRCNEDLHHWFFAGLLLGIACGLKLTNAIFAVTLTPLVLGRHGSAYRNTCRAGCYVLADIVGFAIINGNWAWRLNSEFGNPVFPLANAIFKSPDFPSVGLVDTRFIPDSITEALLLPIHAMAPDMNIYTEWFTPDSRFLVLFVLLAMLVTKVLCTRCFIRQRASQKISFRPQACFVAIWLLTYAVWLYASGNGRYFLPHLLMLGPAIVVLSLRLFGVNRVVAYALVLLVIVQIGFISSTSPRWSPSPWTTNWFEVRPSKDLLNTPYLYLTPTVQTSMYLAPFLHVESVFSNIGGPVALTPDGPGGERIKSLLTRYRGRVRSLFKTKIFKIGDESTETISKAYDGIYERFGLQTAPETCEPIDVMDHNRALGNVEEGKPRIIASQPDYFAPNFISCELVPRTDPGALGTELAHRIDRVFNRIEEACPRRFSPKGMVTKNLTTTWLRNYFNSAATLLYLEDYDKLEYQVLGGGSVSLGHLADWEKNDLPPFDCAVKKGHILG